ncbi:3-beta hydroxysteroid dehydrogenase/isomerase family [Musa troglodytarum]|uniref:3-beta hydroxysteroid dehydrogenase/isomerase family n=1 Tax=Musa troglodytarum TaxID=320322 RepID=A0A9E7G309_9LILI|nr:3-beta hydroxysteroid dehydrogenase/isomerase family [Musa troglodytarum]
MAPAFVHRDPKTVCVMDASCRLGASLVEALLRRGYTVHATAYASSHGSVPDLLHASLWKLNDLRRLQSGENKQQLRCFRADPFDYQSLVDAMKGCCGLFYVFEPPHDQPYDVRADRINSSL